MEASKIRGAWRPKHSLRAYQTELVDHAVRENTIVFLPTGAGKTRIAAECAKWFFSRDPQKLVLFIVQTVPLVFQQAFAMTCDSELSVGRFCGEVAAYSWEHELDPAVNNVVVITAGLLMNLLDDEVVQMEQVGFIPYNAH